MALHSGQRDDQHPNPSTDATTGATRTVLLVEDNADIRSALSALLSQSGWDVISAPDGFDALTAIDQLRPDVVLLDWKMPVINGPDFLKALRQEYDLHMPVLVVSASSISEQAVLDAGASGLIRKPFDIDDVLNAIGRLSAP